MKKQLTKKKKKSRFDCVNSKGGKKNQIFDDAPRFWKERSMEMSRWSGIAHRTITTSSSPGCGVSMMILMISLRICSIRIEPGSSFQISGEQPYRGLQTAAQPFRMQLSGILAESGFYYIITQISGCCQCNLPPKNAAYRSNFATYRKALDFSAEIRYNQES